MKYLLLVILAFAVACSSNSEQKKEIAESDSVSKPIADNDSSIIDKVIVQTRLLTDLSKQYNYLINFYFKYHSQSQEEYYCTILIKDKKSNSIIDSIKQDLSTLLLADTLIDTRSYITGKDVNKEVQDNFFGRLVVADFNFDNREDFAVMNDVGASTGAIYTYYLQDANHKFKPDIFLSDTMSFFPDKIDPINKVLVNHVHANAYEMGESTYKLNAKTGRWKLIKHRFLPFSE